MYCIAVEIAVDSDVTVPVTVTVGTDLSHERRCWVTHNEEPVGYVRTVRGSSILTRQGHKPLLLSLSFSFLFLMHGCSPIQLLQYACFIDDARKATHGHSQGHGHGIKLERQVRADRSTVVNRS